MKVVLSLGKHRPHEESRVDDDADGNDEAHCAAPLSAVEETPDGEAEQGEDEGGLRDDDGDSS